eukprot:325429-Ditylum_brightwellii.AAC.1
MSEIAKISKHYLPVGKSNDSHIKKFIVSDISQMSDKEVLAFVAQMQTVMEHHLQDIKFRANESVQSIMAKALLKFQIKCNNKLIKNVKQYRDYYKHFLIHSLTANKVVKFYKHTHFAVTVVAFDFKPFWHKGLVNDFVRENQLTFKNETTFSPL